MKIISKIICTIILTLAMWISFSYADDINENFDSNFDADISLDNPFEVEGNGTWIPIDINDQKLDTLNNISEGKERNKVSSSLLLLYLPSIEWWLRPEMKKKQNLERCQFSMQLLDS